MFWTIFSGNIIVKVKNEENNGGNMMYDYGLDHRELGEQFFVLTLKIVNIALYGPNHNYTS